MDIEIANNLLNKDGIMICVLTNNTKLDMIFRSKIYGHITQNLFEIKNRDYAKLKNGSRIYFFNVNLSTTNCLRGMRFHKVYCQELLPKEKLGEWYSTVATCIIPPKKNYEIITDENMWELYEE